MRGSGLGGRRLRDGLGGRLARRGDRQGGGRPRMELRLAARLDRERRRDEPVEQRVRPLRAALELGVELARHEPRVVLELDDLDEPAVRATGRRAAGPAPSSVWR